MPACCFAGRAALASGAAYLPRAVRTVGFFIGQFAADGKRRHTKGHKRCVRRGRTESHCGQGCRMPILGGFAPCCRYGACCWQPRPCADAAPQPLAAHDLSADGRAGRADGFCCPYACGMAAVGAARRPVGADPTSLVRRREDASALVFRCAAAAFGHVLLLFCRTAF